MPGSGIALAGDDPIAWLRDCLTTAFPVAGETASPFLWRQTPKPGRRQFDIASLLPVPRSPASAARDAALASIKASASTSDPGSVCIDNASEGRDRRGETRSKLTIYRSAMLRWEEYESLCLIRNISSGGMMAKVLGSFTVDQRVTVEMRSGHELGGRIAWARDGRIGVAFDEPIDVAEVLNGAHRVARHWRQRMPRVHVPCQATLISGGSRETVVLLDLSQGGAKIEAEMLHVDDEVTLAVKGLDPHRGCVRWVSGGRAGISFLTSIPFDALASWAFDRQCAAHVTLEKN